MLRMVWRALARERRLHRKRRWGPQEEIWRLQRVTTGKRSQQGAACHPTPLRAVSHLMARRHSHGRGDTRSGLCPLGRCSVADDLSFRDPAQGGAREDQPHDPRARSLNPEELERQARETVARIKDSLGGFGSRVRDVARGASDLWKDAMPAAPDASVVAPLAEARARALARRWTSVDFLVDPELPEAMRVTALQDSGLWRIEDRERAETRALAESVEPFRGGSPQAFAPLLSPWEYTLLESDEIESGERRDRLPDSGVIDACPQCAGAMRITCAECDGVGVAVCPICHGRATLPCKRCRGRGYIAASASERLASAFLQSELEQFSYNAALRAADLSERLRREYGIPLPASVHWAPVVVSASDAPACPDCDHGRVVCVCDQGHVACETCSGLGAVDCPTCAGAGKVVRYRDVLRRFETPIHSQTLPFTGATLLGGLSEIAVRRAPGETIWEGSVEETNEDAPDGIPNDVWQAARDLIQRSPSTAADASQLGERRVISRRVRLSKVPVTRVEYHFAGKGYSFVAVGRSGDERFWAETFPPRWSRVQRFLSALTRDQNRDESVDLAHAPTDITILEDYRARRRRATDDSGPKTPATVADADTSFSAADD